MRRTVALCLVLVFLLPVTASAFKYSQCGSVNCTWKHWPVSYSINSSGSDDLSDAIDIVEDSFRQWQFDRQTFCGIEFDYLGKTTINKSEPDMQNVIVWVEDGWEEELDTSILALTQCWSDASGHFVDCDILVNGDTYNWGDSDVLTSDVFDLRSTMTHEIGHFWGLDHSNDKNATMYATYSSFSNAADLDYDDILGAKELFCPEFQLPEDDEREPDDSRALSKAYDEEGYIIEGQVLYDDDWFQVSVPQGRRIKVTVGDDDLDRHKIVLLANVAGETLESAPCDGDCAVALGDYEGLEKDTVLHVVLRSDFEQTPIGIDQYKIKIEFPEPGQEGELYDDDDLGPGEGEEFCGCDPGGAWGGATKPAAPMAPMIILGAAIALTLVVRRRFARS